MQVLCTEAPYEAERRLTNWAQETFDKYNLMLTQKAAKENKFIENLMKQLPFTNVFQPVVKFTKCNTLGFLHPYNYDIFCCIEQHFD